MSWRWCWCLARRWCLLRLLFLFALLLLFISFAPSVNKVLLFLQQLRGDAGGGGLGSGLDGGRPFFLFFSTFFSSALFSSVSVSSCFSRGCYWLRWQWQLVAVERKCSVPGGVAAAGKKMVSCPQCWAVPCCCFLRLRRGAGSCFSSMVARRVAGRWWAEEGWWWRGQCCCVRAPGGVGVAAGCDGGRWLREPSDSSCSFLSAAAPSLPFFCFLSSVSGVSFCQQFRGGGKVKVTNQWCWQCWCVGLSLLFCFRASPFSPLLFLSRFLSS